MDLYILENWVLLRALMIFAVVAMLLAVVGITAGVKAWFASRRASRAIPAANRAPRDMASVVKSVHESYATGSGSSARS